MSIKSAKKIGFFSALCMLIGTVVGIGIFFKNKSVMDATGHNGISWLLTWIIGGIIAAAAAISFSEIGKIKTERKGLMGWSIELFKKPIVKFIRFNYGFFYFGCLISCLGIFTSEMIFQSLKINVPIYAHAIVGFVVIALFLGLNLISIKASGIFQQITSILKFMPLIFAVLIGICMPNTNNGGGVNAFSIGSFNIKGIIVALPAVLFAYDAFLNVTTITNKVENGDKKIPLIIIIGMISIIILYTLLSLSSIIHNSGTVEELINQTLPKKYKASVTIILNIFILISMFGVMNGVSAGTISVFEQNAKDNIFAGTKYMKTKMGINKTVGLQLFIIILFWSLVMGIPSSIIHRDYIYGGFSNFPSLFFFVIYVSIIFKYWQNRKKMKIKKMNKWLFGIASLIAIVGVLFVASYLFFGHYIYNFITLSSTDSSWHLLAHDPYWVKEPPIFPEWKEGFILMTSLLIFILAPIINEFIKKRIINKA